jgi:hypothetical protein
MTFSPAFIRRDQLLVILCISSIILFSCVVATKILHLPVGGNIFLISIFLTIVFVGVCMMDIIDHKQLTYPEKIVLVILLLTFNLVVGTIYLLFRNRIRQ